MELSQISCFVTIPRSNKKVMNRTNERNKEFFIESLFSLIIKYDLNNISIDDISRKAGFSRRSFYRHFSSKEELLAKAMERIVDDYSNILLAESDLSIKNIVKVFFHFWSKQLLVLKALERCNLLYTLLGTMNKKISEIYVLAKGESHEYGGQEDRDYVLAFSMGGLWNTLIHWIHNGARQSPDEFAEVVDRVIRIISLK